MNNIKEYWKIQDEKSRIQQRELNLHLAEEEARRRKARAEEEEKRRIKREIEERHRKQEEEKERLLEEKRMRKEAKRKRREEKEALLRARYEAEQKEKDIAARKEMEREKLERLEAKRERLRKALEDKQAAQRAERMRRIRAEQQRMGQQVQKVVTATTTHGPTNQERKAGRRRRSSSIEEHLLPEQLEKERLAFEKLKEDAALAAKLLPEQLERERLAFEKLRKDAARRAAEEAAEREREERERAAAAEEALEELKRKEEEARARRESRAREGESRRLRLIAERAMRSLAAEAGDDCEAERRRDGGRHPSPPEIAEGLRLLPERKAEVDKQRALAELRRTMRDEEESRRLMAEAVRMMAEAERMEQSLLAAAAAADDAADDDDEGEPEGTMASGENSEFPNEQVFSSPEQLEIERWAARRVPDQVSFNCDQLVDTERASAELWRIKQEEEESRRLMAEARQMMAEAEEMEKSLAAAADDVDTGAASGSSDLVEQISPEQLEIEKFAYDKVEGETSRQAAEGAAVQCNRTPEDESASTELRLIEQEEEESRRLMAEAQQMMAEAQQMEKSLAAATEDADTWTASESSELVDQIPPERQEMEIKSLAFEKVGEDAARQVAEQTALQCDRTPEDESASAELWQIEQDEEESRRMMAEAQQMMAEAEQLEQSLAAADTGEPETANESSVLVGQISPEELEIERLTFEKGEEEAALAVDQATVKCEQAVVTETALAELWQIEQEEEESRILMAEAQQMMAEAQQMEQSLAAAGSGEPETAGESSELVGQISPEELEVERLAYEKVKEEAAERAAKHGRVKRKQTSAKGNTLAELRQREESRKLAAEAEQMKQRLATRRRQKLAEQLLTEQQENERSRFKKLKDAAARRAAKHGRVKRKQASAKENTLAELRQSWTEQKDEDSCRLAAEAEQMKPKLTAADKTKASRRDKTEMELRDWLQRKTPPPKPAMGKKGSLIRRSSTGFESLTETLAETTPSALQGSLTEVVRQVENKRDRLQNRRRTVGPVAMFKFESHGFGAGSQGGWEC